MNLNDVKLKIHANDATSEICRLQSMLIEAGCIIDMDAEVVIEKWLKGLLKAELAPVLEITR